MSKLVRQLGVDTAHLLIGFPIAVVAYTVVLTLSPPGPGWSSRSWASRSWSPHSRTSLVHAIVAHRPDVSIVDVRMPPSHTDEGLRAAVEARALVPRGGVGYLLKDRVAEITPR